MAKKFSVSVVLLSLLLTILFLLGGASYQSKPAEASPVLRTTTVPLNPNSFMIGWANYKPMFQPTVSLDFSSIYSIAPNGAYIESALLTADNAGGGCNSPPLIQFIPIDPTGTQHNPLQEMRWGKDSYGFCSLDIDFTATIRYMFNQKGTPWKIYFKLPGSYYYDNRNYCNARIIIKWYKIPDTPQLTSTASEPLSWSNSAGQGRVTLSWNPVGEATGYKVWVFDGYTYRSFDVGNNTSWDSSVWKIYPTETMLDSYDNNTQTGDLFNHVKGGLDLRDDPNKIYKKTAGTTYDNSHNYWFRVTAYNNYGESGQSEAYMPTLPNRTDSTAPTGIVVLNNGAEYTSSTSVTVNLSGMYDPLVSNYTSTTSDDSSGLYQMRFSNDGTTWSAWENYNTSKTWEIPAGNGTKTVYVQVKDTAGNVSGTKTDSIYLDTTKPTGSININSGATYTTTGSVTLSLTAADSASGVSKMRFSNNGSSWTSWENYNEDKSYTLTTGDGTKRVYVQFKDAAGNISNSYNDTIVLDTAAPSGNINVNNGASYTNSTSVTLNINATDATSGVSQMQVSNSSNFSGASWESYAISKSWTLLAGDGTKTVYVRFKDNAGNISNGFTDTITLDTTSPTGNITVKSIDGLSKTASQEVVLTITANDALSGIQGMQLSNNGTSWSEMLDVGSPYDWTLSPGAGTKTVYLKLWDNAENNLITSGDIAMVDDMIGPTVSLTVNGGVTNITDPLVTLDIMTFDNYTKTAEMQMRFSNNGAVWSPWETYSNQKTSWDITDTSYGGTTQQGLKEVYVQVLDAAQNIGQAVTRVGYSTSLPSGEVTAESGIDGIYDGQAVKFVKTSKVKLNIISTDAKQMRVSLDGISWSEWEQYQTSKELNLPKGDGVTVVITQFKNCYGAISNPKETVYVLDKTPPAVKVTIPNGATATTNASINLRISVSDNISTENFQYRCNGGVWTDLPENGQVTIDDLDKDFHSLLIEVCDEAGNIGSDTVNIWSL